MSTSTTDEVPSLDDFGARLAVIRQRFRWNEKTAAVECGFPPQSWRNWEDGARPRDIRDVAQKISDRTGYPFLWVLLGPGYGTPTARSARDSRSDSLVAA